MSRIQEDPRIDPRMKQVFGAFPAPVNPGDATSREQLVEEANSEEAAAMRQRWDAFLERTISTSNLTPPPDPLPIYRRLRYTPSALLGWVKNRPAFWLTFRPARAAGFVVTTSTQPISLAE